jgi:hypothetical protein
VISSQCLLIALSLGSVFLPAAQVAGAETPAREASARAQKAPIVGTWFARVSPDPAPPGAPPNPPPFDELLTFTSDGTVLETNAGLPPLAASPGQGVWVPVSPGVYRATYLKFLFDQQGQPTGGLLVTMRITLSGAGNSFSSVDEVDFLDPAGIVLFTSTGSSKARRLGVEPAE